MFYSLLLTEVDEYMKEQQAALEAEKEKILNDKSLISADKQKLLDDMKAKENALKKEQDTKLDLINKIKTYESKLLACGKNVIDHTN